MVGQERHLAVRPAVPDVHVHLRAVQVGSLCLRYRHSDTEGWAIIVQPSEGGVALRRVPGKALAAPSPLRSGRQYERSGPYHS
jgi:hypothetical protein